MAEFHLYIAELLFRSVDEGLTTKENEELEAWLALSPENQVLKAELEDMDYLQQEWKVYTRVDPEESLSKVKARLGINVGPGEFNVGPGGLDTSRTTKEREGPRVSTTRDVFRVVKLTLASIAAAALLIFGFKWIATPAKPGEKIVKLERHPLLPRQGATLQLAGGQVINLAELAIGFLRKVGCVNISKTAVDRVVLAAIPGCEPSPAGENDDSRLETPRGHWMQATLTDATSVRLSPESVLRFPANLSKGQRIVQLEHGEGYFDIAKARGKDHRPQPFIVEVSRHSKVLKITSTGTRFSVRAYAGETDIRTTLDEGAISVETDGIVIALHPGEAAVLDVNGQLRREPVLSMDTTAWSRGRFAFREQSTDHILDDLARWYDAELVYTNGRPGGIYTVKGFRQDSLPVLLDDLQKMGAPFKYTIHSDTVFVSR